MNCSRILNSLRASTSITWKSTGKFQQTLASTIEKSGKTLHSGEFSTVKLFPAMAGEGRYFVCGDRQSRIPASIDFVTDTVLCTTLSSRDGGGRVRTVEHLLSALEASGVDNCRIEIVGADEVPLLDGSAKEWMEAIERVGLSVSKDCNANSMEKLAPFLHEPVHMLRNDSFIAAFPSPKISISCGINFPQVPAIGCQWFSSDSMDDSFYMKEIASSRTFCIYEEDDLHGEKTASYPPPKHFSTLQPRNAPLILVERLRDAGLIQGGSAENAIVCSASRGWLNPPLHFHDEPCRHKVLDLVGDLSLLAQNGNQGLPVAHIVVYKGGHSLHTEFVRRLLGTTSGL